MVSFYDERNGTCCSIYDGQCVADMHAETLKISFLQSELNSVPDTVALSVVYLFTDKVFHP